MYRQMGIPSKDSDQPVSESGPEVIKLFFILNSAEQEIFHANKSQITNNAKFFLAKHSWDWKISLLINMKMPTISLLINMKMPTIVGIFIFISRENFMFSYI